MTLLDGLQAEPTAKNVAVGIVGIGTAVPAGVSQTDVIPLAEQLAGADDRQKNWLDRVFQKCGVNHRGSVLISENNTPVEDLRAFYPVTGQPEDRGPTTAQRMQKYAQAAPLLGQQAATRALTAAAISPDRITHLITVSCTGFSAPGLDAEMIDRLHLSPAVQRTHIGFMGCHAAFNALGVAQNILRGDAGAIVLIVCVEICSLHFGYGWDPGRIVANALFADGAAAAIVGNIGDGGVAREDHGYWQLTRRASLFLPNTKDAMTWRIADHGFEMTLSPELPQLVQAKLHNWCANWLSEENIAIEEIKYWAIHPGGPKILTAARDALALNESHLHFSRKILANHGNMSSTTILFVLEEMARTQATGPCVALGFGPGLMMEGLLLERTPPTL